MWTRVITGDSIRRECGFGEGKPWSKNNARARTGMCRLKERRNGKQGQAHTPRDRLQGFEDVLDSWISGFPSLASTPKEGQSLDFPRADKNEDEGKYGVSEGRETKCRI